MLVDLFNITRISFWHFVTDRFNTFSQFSLDSKLLNAVACSTVFTSHCQIPLDTLSSQTSFFLKEENSSSCTVCNMPHTISIFLIWFLYNFVNLCLIFSPFFLCYSVWRVYFYCFFCRTLSSSFNIVSSLHLISLAVVAVCDLFKKIILNFIKYVTY